MSLPPKKRFKGGTKTGIKHATFDNPDYQIFAATSDASAEISPLSFCSASL